MRYLLPYALLHFYHDRCDNHGDDTIAVLCIRDPNTLTMSSRLENRSSDPRLHKSPHLPLPYGITVLDPEGLDAMCDFQTCTDMTRFFRYPYE